MLFPQLLKLSIYCDDLHFLKMYFPRYKYMSFIYSHHTRFWYHGLAASKDCPQAHVHRSLTRPRSAHFARQFFFSHALAREPVRRLGLSSTLFSFYKNIFYKNIEAVTCEILRINPEKKIIFCWKFANTIQLSFSKRQY